MSRPLVSLCLIFRDEEAMLPDFLASVQGLWDECIAVDTGSVDGSAALLRAMGVQVVSFPWCDDFAAARNASLQPATGQWILFLDADERVSPELAQAIRTLVTDPTAGAATVVMRNQLPSGSRRDSRLLRLFRNRPEIRFRYRIHEDVAQDVQDMLHREGLQLHHLDGVVEHLGYVREVAADRNKKDRDLALLRLSLEQDPEDFYCRFKILEIARFWEDRDLWRQEAAHCDRLLSGITPDQAGDLKGRNWSGELAVLIAQGQEMHPGMALRWLDRQESWAGKSAAWWLYRAELHEILDQTEEAGAAFQRCLEDRQEASTQLVITRPLLGLCRLAMGRRDWTEAARLALEAAGEAPRDLEALLALAVCSNHDPQKPPLADHLSAHPEAALPTAGILLRQGLVEPARNLLDATGCEDADTALGQLVCCLALGDTFTGTIDTDQETADRLLKGWVSLLWDSRETGAMSAFAEQCQAITSHFPWLPEFLEAETKRLREQSP